MTTILNKRSKLLLIDDDPMMVKLLTKVITKKLGDDAVTVEALTDPHEAIQRLSTEVVDIVVTDFDMPGVDGVELLRVAKQRNACTQVLFVTGKSSQETLLQAMDLGATDYLLKPVDQDELVSLIEQAHERSSRWRNALAVTWQQQQVESNQLV